jgi:hypothetical protein
MTEFRQGNHILEKLMSSWEDSADDLELAAMLSRNPRTAARCIWYSVMQWVNQFRFNDHVEVSLAMLQSWE